MSPEKKCFFIAPIGEDGSEIRKRSDQILKYVVDPPANDCGYKVVRADVIEKPGIITSQVIQYVLDSELVIADLSGRNPNVFYELALRHAVRKPYVQIIQAGEPLPFDVAGVRTIAVDHRDLDSVEKCKRDILGQIRAMEAASGEIESPVTSAVEIQNLKRSSHPVEQNLAEIREILSQLAAKADRTALSVEGVADLVRSQAYEIRDDIFGGVGGPSAGAMFFPTGASGSGKAFTLNLSPVAAAKKKADIAAKAAALRKALDKLSEEGDSSTPRSKTKPEENKE
jgi:hypothetical protein